MDLLVQALLQLLELYCLLRWVENFAIALNEPGQGIIASLSLLHTGNLSLQISDYYLELSYSILM